MTVIKKTVDCQASFHHGISNPSHLNLSASGTWTESGDGRCRGGVGCCNITELNSRVSNIREERNVICLSLLRSVKIAKENFFFIISKATSYL